jgi:hypothetical protein
MWNLRSLPAWVAALRGTNLTNGCLSQAVRKPRGTDRSEPHIALQSRRRLSNLAFSHVNRSNVHMQSTIALARRGQNNPSYAKLRLGIGTAVEPLDRSGEPMGHVDVAPLSTCSAPKALQRSVTREILPVIGSSTAHLRTRRDAVPATASRALLGVPTH